MASFTFCNESTENSLKLQIHGLVDVVNKHRWIIDAYVSDFFTYSHWNNLPTSLQNYLGSLEPPDLAWMLSADAVSQPPCHSVPPLSILALQCCIHSLSLNRIAVDLDSKKTKTGLFRGFHSRSLSSEEACVNSAATGCVQTKPIQESNFKNGQCMDMHHIFRKHVKPKKQHEIQKLGQIISLLSEATGCHNVVDVGAGLGHLSRILSFWHGLKVTTVEAADGHAPKASSFDREVKKDIKKAQLKRKHKEEKRVLDGAQTVEETASVSYLTAEDRNDSRQGELPQTSKTSPHHSDKLSTSTSSPEDMESTPDDPLPSHVVCTVQPDIAASQFMEILTSSTKEGNPSQSTFDPNFMLVGLHACGDLTPSLLRVFLSCPTAVGLASVACCYMKIQSPETVGSSELLNYPMSTFVKNLPCHHLTYEAREMACHFADAYHQRLRACPDILKIHAYRAALQYLVVKVSPQFKSGQVRLVSKKGVLAPFSQYVAENLKKLKIDSSSVPRELLDHCEKMTQQWRHVVAFYTLRLSLAPVVETLILLDRAMFLMENGIPSALVPIFDANMSPRNFALLAIKS